MDVVLTATKRSSVGGGLPGTKNTYHLYPTSEIPSRTEAVIVARSNGNNWIPTSGIDGDLVFANLSKSWAFRIQFSNSLFRSSECAVNAISIDHSSGLRESLSRGRTVSLQEAEGIWQAFHETIDGHDNNEVLVSIDKKYQLATGPIQNMNSQIFHSQMRLTDLEDNLEAAVCSAPPRDLTTNSISIFEDLEVSPSLTEDELPPV
jgi:hypothetical protein